MAKYKKRADGRYATSVIIGYDNSGKAKRKILYGNTIRELDNKVADFKSLQNKGIYINDKGLTFEEWARSWLELYKSTKEYNTYSTYKRTVENHLIPAIGDIKLSSLKKHHLQELLNGIVEKGYHRTAELAKLTIKQIINAAIDEQYIFNDISRKLSLPERKTPPKRALTAEEYQSIVNAELPPNKRLFVDILLYTGIRRGEILALTPKDINMNDKTLKISKTVIFKDNTPEVKNTPKSNSGNRIIPIPDVLSKSISSNLPYCGKEYIFTQEKSDMLISKSSYRKFWESLSKEIGIPDDVTAHTFRHNYATKLYYGGVDVKTAQMLLGHANIQITLEIYTHLEQSSSAINDKINNIF